MGARFRGVFAIHIGETHLCDSLLAHQWPSASESKAMSHHRLRHNQYYNPQPPLPHPSRRPRQGQYYNPQPLPLPTPHPSPTTAGPSSSSTAAMDRPGFGSLGNQCMVLPNHFPVDFPDTMVEKYMIRCWSREDGGKSTRKYAAAFEACRKLGYFGKQQPVYDGFQFLYLRAWVPHLASRSFIFVNTYKGSSITYNVNIEYVGLVQIGTPEHLYDLVFQKILSQRFQKFGRIFMMGSPTYVGRCLTFRDMFWQILSRRAMGLTLLTGISTVPFFCSTKTVLDFVRDFCDGPDEGTSLLPHVCQEVDRVLKGVYVKITYSGERKKFSRLSRRAITKERFYCRRQKRNMSVAEFVQNVCNVHLTCENWQGVVVEGSGGCFPMEVCEFVDAQKYRHELHVQQRDALRQRYNELPGERLQRIKRVITNSGYSNDYRTQELGVLVQDLRAIPARVLEPPMIQYLNEREVPQEGCWERSNKKMYSAATVDNWICLNFSALASDVVQKFCDTLATKSVGYGMNFNLEPSEVRTLPPENLEVTIRGITDLEKLNLLVVILPVEHGFYGKVKRLCELDLGIITQCCRSKKVELLSGDFLESIIWKINVKVGGQNYQIVSNDQIGRPFYFSEHEHTIVFGADVTHYAGSAGSYSIAAVVASMDWPNPSRYRAELSSQTAGVEIIGGIKELVRSQLLAFEETNGVLPKRLLFYRDGVGESQFRDVMISEVDLIKEVCVELYRKDRPRLTFVVVQKRHRTRFFPEEGGLSTNNGNVLPGTVIDSDVCSENAFDFYLLSHVALEGTSRPTHYQVLMDESDLGADAIQLLTYNLCHTCSHFRNAVSLVPPVFYAHLAAYRARFYIGNGTVQPCARIRDGTNMFYL